MPIWPSKRNIDFNVAFVNCTGGSEKDSPKAEMKRSRSDLLTVILQQLSTSLANTATSTTWNPLSEESADCTVSYFFLYELFRTK